MIIHTHFYYYKFERFTNESNGIDGELDIQIVYRRLMPLKGKTSIKGEWGFSFKASGDKIKAETKNNTNS